MWVIVERIKYTARRGHCQKEKVGLVGVQGAGGLKQGGQRFGKGHQGIGKRLWDGGENVRT